MSPSRRTRSNINKLAIPIPQKAEANVNDNVVDQLEGPQYVNKPLMLPPNMTIMIHP